MKRSELMSFGKDFSRAERTIWTRAFLVNILFEIVLLAYSFAKISDNCNDCLLLYSSSIVRMVLDLGFTASLWLILHLLRKKQPGNSIPINVMVFVGYFLLWIGIRFALIRLGLVVDPTAAAARDPLRYLLYMSWYDIGKYVLKLSAFYMISFYLVYRKAEQQRTEMAMINKDLQLNLLRQQLSPHFYFNTLNNLYGLARSNSGKLPGGLAQLSTIMQYVLHDCNRPKVLLQQEIMFLQSYIALEKLRYEENTFIDMEVTGTVNGQQILPLLLIQFVENAFKHGMKEKSEKSWMKVKMDISGQDLLFSVENSCNQIRSEEGIGISSARRRLSLLYENRHQLQMTEKEEQFSVQLKLQLS